MGRPDAVMPWIARYRDRMLPRLPARDVFPVGTGAALSRAQSVRRLGCVFGEGWQEAAWSECSIAGGPAGPRVLRLPRRMASSVSVMPSAACGRPRRIRVRELADALA